MSTKSRVVFSVPALQHGPGLAVYVFIHGGGFVYGRAETGADFLVQQDIVVATIQYRLGPFGER